MEEDIKNLSEIIELCEEEINNNDENVSAILDLTDLKSLRNLIKEYKNLKEIEENHRKENGELREQVKELEEENKKLKTMDGLNIFELGKESSGQRIEYDYIPKSKIKEKIEELKENGYWNYLEERDLETTIDVLQELLEEGK